MKKTILRYLSLAALLFIASVSAILHHRALATAYSHPDEEIARAVVGRVLATGSADTNWVRTDVAQVFHYNQFNFSSYYLVAAQIEKFLGNRADDLTNANILIQHLRVQNVWVGALSVLLTGFLAMRLTGRRRLAPFAGIIAALLTACCVTLFQDDIYGRPEAFVTALTLLYTLVLVRKWRTALPMLILSGVIMGVLLAAKVTFAVFLPFPLLVAATHGHADGAAYPHPWRVSVTLSLYAVCVGAGFAIGAPYAIQAPWEYLEGLSVLFKAYNGGWHQSLSDATVFARIRHGLAYLLYISGWVTPVLVGAGLFALVRERRYAILLALAGPLLTLLYFLQVQAFFERNFSHALPVLFALAGTGSVAIVDAIPQSWVKSVKPSVARLLLAVLLTALAVYPGYAVSARLFATLRDRVDIEKQIGEIRQQLAIAEASPVLMGYSDFAGMAKLRNGLCGKVIYQMQDFGYQPDLLSNLSSQGYRIERIVRGPFDDAPFSTLQQYHSSNTIFLQSPQDQHEHPCSAELIAPAADPPYREIHADTKMTSAWTLNGYPPPLSLAAWPHPFYASWSGSDAKTGDLEFGPFEACGDVVIPYAVGPVSRNTELKIERVIEDSHEIITQGPPPPVLAWAAIKVPAGKHCASYTIHAGDHGAGWGEWIGVGMPVESSRPDTPANTGSTRGVSEVSIRKESIGSGKSPAIP